MTLLSIEWLPAPGFPAYEVSTDGQIRRNGRLLTPTPDKYGYLYVSLSKNNKKTRKYVHRLVLETFVGPGEGLCGLHFDDVCTNNTLENLRWGTRVDNNWDRVKNGNHPATKRERCPRGHELREPNLVACNARNGHRNCLACNRAQFWGKYRNLPLIKEVADSYYERIMT